uniref:Uncharacterized protein ycf35 n=1 Tax=Liagora brachyclada TaxID=1884665 RepID=A0A1G4NZP6_9FLOR|nr:Hypothetical protein ycf35 [Liagora brachyclada]SCW24112.1 Hypothetical protein ycf35 [Liagora brachyclada]
MSHLSKIQTKMTDIETLKDTLKDFNIFYTIKHTNNEDKPSILLTNDFEGTKHIKAEFSWTNNNYELVADSSTWQDKIFLEHWQHKVYQKYACNTIIKEGIKAGFTSNLSYTSSSNDGTVKLVLEKWSK